MTVHFIKLTPSGEKLYVCQPGSFEVMGETSSIRRGCALGTHWICDGLIKMHNISENLSALCCDKCYLRVVVPRNVKTYGDLVRFLESGETVGT